MSYETAKAYAERCGFTVREDGPTALYLSGNIDGHSFRIRLYRWTNRLWRSKFWHPIVGNSTNSYGQKGRLLDEVVGIYRIVKLNQKEAKWPSGQRITE